MSAALIGRIDNCLGNIWSPDTDQVLADCRAALEKTDALIEALRELEFCARKLRHSAEHGNDRRRGLERIDAAIKAAAKLTQGGGR